MIRIAEKQDWSDNRSHGYALRALQRADDLPSRGELLVCGIAALPCAGGCERVFVPGVLEETIADGEKAGLERYAKRKPKSKKTAEDEINTLRFFGHPHRMPSE